MKIQFLNKYCQVYLEKQPDGGMTLYFYLKTPPKYFVSMSETGKHQNRLIRDTMNWQRVPNIFVQSVEEKGFFIHDADRVNLINHQVIKCCFSPS